MLTKCKECGREVSDKAHVCPHCGAPTHRTVAGSPERLATMLCLVSIVGCLLAAVSSWPYGLYVLLRFVVCGSTAFLAWASTQTGWGKWAWILGITAVIFNPVVPFAFGRPLWAVLGRCLCSGTHHMAHTENQLESQNSQTCVWRPAKIGELREHLGRRATRICRYLRTRSHHLECAGL